MKPLSVAITTDDWALLRQSLFTDDGNENAAVLFCGAADMPELRRMMARFVWEVPRHEYVVRLANQLEVSPRFFNRVIDRCLAENLQPVIVHSHPEVDDPSYSQSDNYGEARLLPVLETLLPRTTSASLLLGRKTAKGRRFIDGGFSPLESLRIVGQRSRVLSLREDVESSQPMAEEQFDRQIRAFGPESQYVLQRLKVGIVGVGGTGSVIAEQLVRAGVRDLIIIDPDLVEVSNVTRLFGAELGDVGKTKVEVLGAHLQRLGAEGVECLPESAIRQRVLMRLRDRDIVFGCVDNDRSRAILNRFSHQYLIPIVDIGIRLDAREGEICAAAGRVSVVGSGMVCLRCSHHLDPRRIFAESLPADERESLAREGYVLGIDAPAPGLVSMNITVAGLGATAALNLFVGLTGGQQPVDQLYDATTGVVFTSQAVHEEGCDVCGNNVGVKARGDGQIVSAYD